MGIGKDTNQVLERRPSFVLSCSIPGEELCLENGSELGSCGLREQRLISLEACEGLVESEGKRIQ